MQAARNADDNAEEEQNEAQEVVSGLSAGRAFSSSNCSWQFDARTTNTVVYVMQDLEAWF